MNKQAQAFRSITADNGTEFHQYQPFEKETETCFYFDTPHYSGERGTNENTNGLIRPYLPKGTSLSDLAQQPCDAIAYKLNTRPRKRLNFQTPGEVCHA